MTKGRVLASLVGVWAVGTLLAAWSAHAGLARWSRPATSPFIPLALGASIAVLVGGTHATARRQALPVWLLWSLTVVVAALAAVVIGALVIRPR